MINDALAAPLKKRWNSFHVVQEKETTIRPVSSKKILPQ